MRIICPVKRVPDTAADKAIESDNTLDRENVEVVLNANDEWAIEEALRIKERTPGTEAIALCVGPATALPTIRKALSYGLDGAIHVKDDAIAGSDASGIARILAAALAGESYDLVIMGNQSSDARTMLVPAMLAECLGVPALTFVKRLEFEGADGSTTFTADRETPTGHKTVVTQGPVVVSVVEAINEPRYPSFKGIMAAKKKPVTEKSLADLGVGADEVGLDGAWTQVHEMSKRPPKEAGEKVEDDGSGTVGAKALVDYLTVEKFV